MEISNQGKRRRKGISVSLTPDKRAPIVNQPQIRQAQPSPINQQIILQQSYARVGMQPIIPKFVRVIPVTRPLDCPNVRFTYSNVSKQQQIKEGLALDQQLHVLRKQLQSKRQTVDALNRQRAQLLVSNVRPIYSVQQTRNSYTNNLQSTQTISLQPITIVQQQFRPIKSPVHHFSPIRVNAFSSDPIVTEFKPKVQSKEINTSVGQLKELSSAKQQNKTNPQKTLTQTFNNKFQVSPNIKKQIKQTKQVKQNKQVKQFKQVKKEQILQIQKRNSINKQNSSKLSQRIQKLKWAEQKLVEIIKVCDKGL